MESVKPRRYDASRRRAQALRTRQAILDAARRRFLHDGYTATTIASIADDADASPDTIYKSFGGKPGLLRAMCEDALSGGGPVPAEQRSDAMQAAATDPATLLRGLGTLTAEVAPRIAPLLLLLATAAESDPALADLHAQLEDARLARMAQVARTLAGKTRYAPAEPSPRPPTSCGPTAPRALPPARAHPGLDTRTLRPVRRRITHRRTARTQPMKPDRPVRRCHLTHTPFHARQVTSERA